MSPIKHQGGGQESGGKVQLFVAVGYVGGNGSVQIPEQQGEQNVALTDLPSIDPHVKGQLWNSAGVLTISAG